MGSCSGPHRLAPQACQALSACSTCGDAVGTARFPASQHLSATQGKAEDEKKAQFICIVLVATEAGGWGPVLRRVDQTGGTRAGSDASAGTGGSSWRTGAQACGPREATGWPLPQRPCKPSLPSMEAQGLLASAHSI